MWISTRLGYRRLLIMQPYVYIYIYIYILIFIYKKINDGSTDSALSFALLSTCSSELFFCLAQPHNNYKNLTDPSFKEWCEYTKLPKVGRELNDNDHEWAHLDIIIGTLQGLSTFQILPVPWQTGPTLTRHDVWALLSLTYFYCPPLSLFSLVSCVFRLTM